MGALVLLFFVLVAPFLIYVALGVKIVQQHERGVVERFGRFKEEVNPGLKIILPFIEALRRVDMREQVIDVPPQEVITEDNVTVSVDAVVYYEATDARRLLYQVANFVLAVTKLAQTNLRNVIGEMSLDEAFTSRERVNSSLRQILDDATDKWGVRVVRVEIQRIDPPMDVMNAMHEQMKAERTRRAVVLEADGAREAEVTRAEGEKQSAILTAEGVKQRDILTAEGEAQAVKVRAEAEQYRQEVVAEGEAQAIDSVFRAITDAGTDDRVIAIKYLEALQGIADGNATKIVVPMEMGGVAGAIGGLAEMLKDDFPAAATNRRERKRPAPIGLGASSSSAATAPGQAASIASSAQEKIRRDTEESARRAREQAERGFDPNNPPPPM